MKPAFSLFLSRRLAWLNVPGAMLLVLLQRTPVLRVATSASEWVMASPFGTLLRSALATTATLGAMHSLAGATEYKQSQPNPVPGKVGEPLSLGFTIIGSPTPPNKFFIDGPLPPGLATIPETSNNAINSGTPVITGTPTQAGSFSVSVTGTDGTYSQTETIMFEITGGAGPAPAPTVAASKNAVAVGDSVTFTASASSGVQWLRNGSSIAGATNSTLTVSNVQPGDAGLYAAVVGSETSGPALVGLSSSVKLVGAGQEFPNIPHPNTNIFDQILPGAAAVAITADAGQAVRMSFIDLTNDIVQLEFSGAGTLTLVLDNPTGPAAPLSYNQATVSYMKGHPTIIITGANQTTNVGLFCVGRATAFDFTGAYNILQAPSATNVPANNGSPLFAGHAATTYDGLADVALIAISSTNGQFGGLRCANASFFAAKGYTGVYAPGVQFTGPVFMGDINADLAATPVILLGSAADTRITGGDLKQTNNRAVQVSGLNQLQFRNGSDSHGNIFAAKTNQGVLEQNGTNVTAQIAQPPTP